MLFRAVAAVSICLAAGPALPAEPVPHEALYDLSVRNWKLPSEIARVSGTQIVRLERGCTQWMTKTAFHLEAEIESGDSIDFETEFQSVETFDGKQLQFRKITKADGAFIELLEGVAARAAPGEEGEIALFSPTDMKLPLPAEVLFPIGAFMFTSGHWENGIRNANYVLFDGTTPDIFHVFEILTNMVNVPSPSPDSDAYLLDGKAWRSTVALHAYESNLAEPVNSLSQNVMPNGVTAELSLDIGFADVVLNLRRVQAVAEPEC